MNVAKFDSEQKLINPEEIFGEYKIEHEAEQYAFEVDETGYPKMETVTHEGQEVVRPILKYPLEVIGKTVIHSRSGFALLEEGSNFKTYNMQTGEQSALFGELELTQYKYIHYDKDKKIISEEELMTVKE